MMRSATIVPTALLFSFATAAALGGLTPVEEKGKVETSDFGVQWKEVVWTDDGARMVLIPAGTYRIGTGAASEPGFVEREGPEITVTVGSYYIDVNEVEYEQYMKIASAVGLPQPMQSGGRAGANAPGLPVTGVSWTAANGFAESLHRALPTEAEWEIAGRGAAGNLYPWGNAPKEGAVLARGSVALPAKVGSSAVDVSDFGVHDMAGNVAEWTSDSYVRGYYSKVAGQESPRIQEGVDSRTVRGGSYYSTEDGRMTLRGPGVPNQSREEVGFRTVYRLVPTTPTPTPTPTPIPATPTPTADSRLSSMREVLGPLLASGSYVIPSRYDASVKLSKSIPVMNRTPFDARIAGVSLDDGLVYFAGSSVESGQTQKISMPPETLVNLFAWAATPTGERLISLGLVNEAGGPLVTLDCNTFAPVGIEEGEPLEAPDEIVAKQTFAGGYYPQWNEVFVFNGSPLPVEFVVGNPQRDGSAKEKARHVVMAGESMLLRSLKAGDWRMTAHYVGGLAEEQSNKVDFKIDEKADLRMFVLSQATAGELVQVMSRREPLIEIRQKDVTLPAEFRPRYLPGGTEASGKSGAKKK